MVSRKQVLIAVLAVLCITIHLMLRFGVETDATVHQLPLLIALVLGGVPLIWDLAVKVFNREFGSDLLAGISIVTSVLLGEYLAGTLVVLMLAGGEALEAYAVRSASSVLAALAKRMPSVAHRKSGTTVQDVGLEDIRVGDVLLVLPHEICPVDGTVMEGHGVMDESYLTGEPYLMSKTPGSTVLSGSINGDSALTIRADKLPVDSRYAKIMQVMESSQQHRPKIRRLGDQLGAFYTPLAVTLGVVAWFFSGDPVRFLAVMVVATPCPLLIAIPVTVIGSISLAARRGIIVRDPAALEQVDACRTIIFDKTGTLTYGKPRLTGQQCRANCNPDEVLALVASLEQYSKHPLAEAIVAAARSKNLRLQPATRMSERPGEGLRGVVDGKEIWVTSRQKYLAAYPGDADLLTPQEGGLECVIVIDERYAATYQFRDAPRQEGVQFVSHLARKHGIRRVVLLSGDRESEVEYLAKLVGISEYYGGQSPEDKLEFVTRETALAKTMFVGDGINDAPALTAATVGVAFGQNSDVTTEAADAVIMDSSLAKVDEFMHISQRMRGIALESAVGGMALSVVGMLIATAGYLPPVAGAVGQEIIDLLAVLNALRVAMPPRTLVDF
ncbi:MAG: cadmium-translocating P-type ATPase [Planctomycetota bacterium]|nr:MAG: cadmium-translocating P-type ATPase [Planctomycetota bacterium]